MCHLNWHYVVRCGWVWLDDDGGWQPFRLPIGYLTADDGLAAAVVIERRPCPMLSW